MTAGIFQDHCFVNHGQFEMSRRIVHRQTPVFRQGHNKQGNEREQMTGI